MAINVPRMMSAPIMPQNRTRCWYAAGTAKKENNTTNTKMLSKLSDFSIRYPARKASAASLFVYELVGEIVCL